MRALALVAVALGLSGQPAFEVASVKPNNLDTRGFIGAVPGGEGFRGFKATGARLIVLAMLAYNVPDWRITGGPGWISSDAFDIDARTENPTSYEQIRLMLQRLLEERFQLTIRRETREEPGYALRFEKDSPNLVPHADDGMVPRRRTSGGSQRYRQRQTPTRSKAGARAGREPAPLGVRSLPVVAAPQSSAASHAWTRARQRRRSCGRNRSCQQDSLQIS
jgi:uncharacterized protein (TIGR03435 family)